MYNFRIPPSMSPEDKEILSRDAKIFLQSDGGKIWQDIINGAFYEESSIPRSMRSASQSEHVIFTNGEIEVLESFSRFPLGIEELA